MFKLELYLTVWNLNINIIFQKCKLFSTQFRFLYTDKTSVTMDNLEDLLFCADKYKTDLLASLCRTSLVTFISSSLVCKVMRIAQCFSDSQIIDICLIFFFWVIAVANKRYETMSVQMKKRNWLKIRSLHSKDVSENWWFNFDRKTNTYFSLQNRFSGNLSTAYLHGYTDIRRETASKNRVLSDFLIWRYLKSTPVCDQ